MIQGITPFNTITSITLFLSLTLGIFLLFKQSPRQRANLFLGLLMLYTATFFISGYLWGARVLEYFPHSVHIGLFFSMILGPLIYFYVRACTEKDFRMRPVDYLHFLPLLLDLLFSLPHITTSGVEKIAQFELFLKEGKYQLSTLHLTIKAIHVCIYLVLSARLVYLYRQYLENTVSHINAVFHRWLLFFSCLLLLPIFTLIITAFTGYEVVSLLLFIFTLLFFVFAVYIALMISPAIFHKFPHQIEISAAPSTANEREKYEHSRLDETQKEEFLQRLQQFMQTHKPYREPELTIGQLAERLDIPTTYLSQVINEKLEVNFMDFVNQYRIEAAKELLSKEKYEHYTIIAIGLDAGFNSKSAFYAAFKRFTNTTPGKFRKSLIIS